MRDRAGAEAAAAAVSDPDSSSYGHYLSPAQVRARYAATDATVRAVRRWLGSAGFRVGATASNNAYVEASGTVAQIQREFAVHLNIYSVGGQHRRATDADLNLPSSIASSVLSVNGLTQSLSRPLNTGATASPATVPPPDGFRNAPPCSANYGQKVDTIDPSYNGRHLPYAPCGYKPAQLRSAYGIAGGRATGRWRARPDRGGYRSGGGTSRLFAEPAYQRGVVPDTLARENQTGSNRGRVVPDISMDGDPNRYDNVTGLGTPNGLTFLNLR
jgi:subtilase family serine protease